MNESHTKETATEAEKPKPTQEPPPPTSTMASCSKQWRSACMERPARHTHTTLAPIKGLPVRVYPTTRPLLEVALLRLISRARAHLTLLPPPVRRRGAKSGRLLSVGVSADWLAGIECANCFAVAAAAATDAPSAGVHHSSSLQPVLWFPRFPLRRWSRARKRANAKQADDEAKAAAAAATAASCCCSLGHCLSIQFSLLLAVGTQKQMLQAAPPNEPAGWPAAAEEAI